MSKSITSSNGSSQGNLEKLAESLTLTKEGLAIENEKTDNGVHYLLLPPESYYSRVSFRAMLKAKGKQIFFLTVSASF